MTDHNTPASARIAEGLELVATKIREFTIDRAAVGITWAAVGLILIVVGGMAAYWLLVGIFRALGTLIGVETAYALVGGVLIIGGSVAWLRRYPQDRPSQEE